MLLVDTEVLKQLDAMSIGLVQSLLPMYFDEAATNVDAIATAARGGDDAQVVRLAHTLKSSSRTVGAMQMGELCEQIERGGLSPSAKEVDALKALFAETRAGLEDYLDSVDH